ncbi:hypothetical protein ACLKA6_019578 [Drosophila palustris]
MSHLLRRTKKSCLKLLRKISTSKQLFVQRLDEDEEDEEETAENLEKEQQEQDPEQEQDQKEQLQQSAESIAIRFDLMHYKENVRYLRHTPSNSSLDLQLEQQQQLQQLQQQQLQLQLPMQQQRATCSVSVNSKFDGNYHNVIIMEQPPNDDYPIVKWDINGNSLDEEHFDLRQHWDAFDNRWRQLQSLQTGKRLGSAHSHSHSQSQRSSHHSSSCTLETWIDDAELGLCDESQNLLQTNHNNNNSNCNQCLKSF